MLINNKTSRFLTGPYIFFGILFLFPAILGLIEMAWALFIPSSIICWFLFGTYSGVEIQTEKRQFRKYDMWFGVLKTGKWISLDIFLGITLVSMRQVYRMYSRSNRINSSAEMQFRICLVNKKKKPAIEIKKCKTREHAQKCLDEFAIWLHLPVYSIKH